MKSIIGGITPANTDIGISGARDCDAKIEAMFHTGRGIYDNNWVIAVAYSPVTLPSTTGDFVSGANDDIMY